MLTASHLLIMVNVEPEKLAQLRVSIPEEHGFRKNFAIVA